VTTPDAIAPARWTLRGLRARRPKRARARAAPLTFSREKKLLLGTLAVLVALPFPLNEPRPQGVVSWPVVLLYVAAVAVFLVRAFRGREIAFPMWSMNVAGLIYLPIFLMRLRAIGPVHIARPMVELLLFGLVMRLYGMRREREKWHVAVLLFFLFIAATATSVHPLIMLYLVVALVLWLLLLLRFLELHLEETYPVVVPGSRLRPQHVVATFAALTLFGAVPFFTVLPRLRSPYLMGGTRAAQAGYATGFRDQVNLDVVGNIRESPIVALRMKPDDPTYRPPALLRGTTYDRFSDNSWLRSQSQPDLLRPTASSLYRLAAGEVTAKIRFWLEPIETRSLMLPTETLSVELSRRLYQDVAGGILVLQPRGGMLEYRVGVADRPVHRAPPPRFEDPEEPTLDRGGITPRIAELARTLAGDLPTTEAAYRIQRYLGENMVYTLDFLGRDAANPIEDFLFRYHSGHCEYFATAMILMLRSVGIPARLATGFMGSEFNPLEDYYIVRQSNAHAWVEAYLPETGWTTLDPTPPSGRPAIETRPTMRLVLRQTWDYLEFRWDRYVMSYGFLDQVGFLLRLRELLQGLGRSERPAGEVESVEHGSGRERQSAPVADFLRVERPAGALVLLLMAVLVAALVWRARSTLPVATRAYGALRAAVARRDPAIGPSTGPIALRRWLERQLPAAGAPAAGLIDLYLLESYRGTRLARAEAAAVRRDLRELRKLLRRVRPRAGV
jgi:transglutaminase-like putative cysteine protease